MLAPVPPSSVNTSMLTDCGLERTVINALASMSVDRLDLVEFEGVPVTIKIIRRNFPERSVNVTLFHVKDVNVVPFKYSMLHA